MAGDPVPILRFLEQSVYSGTENKEKKILELGAISRSRSVSWILPGKKRSLTSPGMEKVSAVFASMAAFSGQAVSSPLLEESLSLPLEELSEDSESPRPRAGGAVD